MREFDEIPIGADDQTVRGLYEACAGIRPWRSALQAANVAIGARSARLLIVDSRTRHPLAVEEVGDDDASHAADAPRRLDEQLRMLWTRDAGEAICIPGADAMGRACHTDATSVIAGKVREHRRNAIFVSFARTRRAFTPTEFAHGARYIGHLASAMKVTQQCEDMKSVATVGERIIHTSSRPMLLLGAGREVLAANTSARTMLRKRDVIRMDSGALKCANPANDLALSKVVDRFTSEPRSQHERRQRAAVKLVAPDAGTILCSVSNMVPEEETSAFADEHPVALLAFAALDVSEAQMDAECLASLYNFTPAELRIVSSLLRGDDLVQIASRNAISLATVRTQLKSVFAKTNTHRQAQVVQLLLTALLL
jgi:DNA-binding CsgD family transcriptional regulator